MCYYIIGVSAWFGVFGESPTKGPPGPRSTDYIRCAPAMAIMSRYGSAIYARFFIFPLTRPAHNTINGIQKLFSDHVCVCNFTHPLHMYSSPHSTNHCRRSWVYLCILCVYYIYNINVWYVYTYICILYFMYSIIINNKGTRFRHVLKSGER